MVLPVGVTNDKVPLDNSLGLETPNAKLPYLFLVSYPTVQLSALAFSNPKVLSEAIKSWTSVLENLTNKLSSFEKEYLLKWWEYYKTHDLLANAFLEEKHTAYLHPHLNGNLFEF